MKQLLLLLLLTGCCKEKDPPKKCYTVINVHILSLTPDIYRITYASPTDTIKVVTRDLYPVGYNTCTGYNWNVNFKSIPQP